MFLTCTCTTVPSRSLYQAVLHLLPGPSTELAATATVSMPLLMLRSLHPIEVVVITTKKKKKKNRSADTPARIAFQ